MLFETPDGIVIRVHVQPGSRRRQIVGLHDERLKLSVTEPPEKGRANTGVIELLAEVLDLLKSAFRLIRGETSRQKDLQIETHDRIRLLERLQAQLG